MILSALKRPTLAYLLCFSAFLIAGESNSKTEFDPNVLKKIPMKVSAGERVEVADKGFSIIAPEGWEIRHDYPNTSLLMQIPYEPTLKYQRTIQVLAFNEPVYIDGFTAREYEELIIKKFSKASGSIDDYRIRNHMIIELANRSQGILYYSEFTLDKTPFMQIHIVVSSATRHFVLTYTDIASHFESEKSNDYLNVAWQSMTSISVDSHSPTRFSSSLYIGIGVGILALIGLIFGAIRFWSADRKYKHLAQDIGDLADVPTKSHHGEDEWKTTRPIPLAEKEDDDDDDLNLDDDFKDEKKVS